METIEELEKIKAYYIKLNQWDNANQIQLAIDVATDYYFITKQQGL